MVGGYGFIYVMGGYLEDSDEPTNTLLRYDIVNKTWLELRPMGTPRAQFGAALVDFAIYVMGGINQSTILRSVEK